MRKRINFMRLAAPLVRDGLEVMDFNAVLVPAILVHKSAAARMALHDKLPRTLRDEWNGDFDARGITCTRDE